MTEQFSVQYSTMQISFIHMMLNIHIVWGNKKKKIITQSTEKKKKKWTVCLFVQIETLNHAPTAPTYTNKFIFQWRND